MLQAEVHRKCMPCYPRRKSFWPAYDTRRSQAAQCRATPPQPKYRLPNSKEEIIIQAHKACLAAWKAGIKRQRVDVLLPLIGATILDDWPGGIRQESLAATPMMEDLLRRLKADTDLQGPLRKETWEEGDAVTCWKGKSLGLILFLTGETLKQAKNFANDMSDGLILMVNPQWQSGQLISDLGFGPWRRKNEEFIDSFQNVYTLKRLRISGDNVRLLKQYPGPWSIFLTSTEGEDQCLATQEEQPTYKELQQLLKDTPSSNSSKPLAERLQAEFNFNRDSIQ